MKYKLHKILFALFLIFSLFAGIAHVKAIDTLISYPEISGQKLYFGMTLPELIKYIYLFAMGISGAVALTSMLIGAIKYVAAAGNPSKMSDAKDQIFSAILGVIILLSSYIILNTINPDLVNFGVSMTSVTQGPSQTGTSQNQTTQYPNDYPCATGADCLSGYCDYSGTCATNPNQTNQNNTTQNNTGTNLPNGSYCTSDNNCASGYCDGGICVPF